MLDVKQMMCIYTLYIHTCTVLICIYTYTLHNTVYTHACMHIHIHIHICMHIYIHACLYAYMHSPTCMHACMHAHTHTHTYIHTLYTYIATCYCLYGHCSMLLSLQNNFYVTCFYIIISALACQCDGVKPRSDMSIEIFFGFCADLFTSFSHYYDRRRVIIPIPGTLQLAPPTI